MSSDGTKPRCPQCGAPLEVADGAAYVRCPFCKTSSFVDLAGAIRHEMLRPTVSRARVPGQIRARAHAAGWPDAQVEGLELVYEPVWELEGAHGARVHVGARPDAHGRFPILEVPGGERALVEASARQERGVEWLEPELAPESAPEVAARALERPVAAAGVRLLHRPVYHVKIQVAGQDRAVRVDAVTGDLLDVDWPARPSFTGRNRAWTALGAMILSAFILPLPWSAAAVLALGIGALALVRARQKTGTAA